MDGFSGYNQIKMAPMDMTKATFITNAIWAQECGCDLSENGYSPTT